jgi:hypothetical protein
MKKGRMKSDGLCDIFFGDDLFDAFHDSIQYHATYGYSWYWGYNGEKYEYDWFAFSISQKRSRQYKFTTLRQTMVLFMAAMNEEL